VHDRARLALVAVLAGVLGCDTERIAATDEVYFAWDDRRVLCGVGIADNLDNDLDSLAEGMERALARGEVLILYAHAPDHDVSVAKLEAVLALASQVGVPFLTFAELHGPVPAERAGVALTFDDAYVDAWYGMRDLLAMHGARVTFFVTRFHRLSETRVDALRELRAAGHAIESHGHNHLHGPDYVEEHGVRAYIDDEVLPALEAMRQAGFAPTTFAYPFGARTSEIDRAVLEHVALVRSLSWTFGNPLIADPCPE
jgi:peptidoglycan/xylan/chitin deacetylase (PgdA/CDA1 family)